MPDNAAMGGLLFEVRCDDATREVTISDRPGVTKGAGLQQCFDFTRENKASLPFIDFDRITPSTETSLGSEASTLPFAVHGAHAKAPIPPIKKYVECTLDEEGLYFKYDDKEAYEDMLSFLDMHRVDLNLKESVDLGYGPCRFNVLVNRDTYEVLIKNKEGEAQGVQQCLSRLKLNHVVPETAFSKQMPELG